MNYRNVKKDGKFSEPYRDGSVLDGANYRSNQPYTPIRRFAKESQRERKESGGL